MLIFKLITYTLFITGFVACSSSQKLAVKSIFPFQYQGEEYEIISINNPAGEGLNTLIQYENDSTVVRVNDRNQDGFLDMVVMGDITLEEANTIYTFGINEAIKQGKYKQSSSTNRYKYETDDGHFIIQTFDINNKEVYNEFTIYNDKGNIQAIFLDVDANGKLDSLKHGKNQLNLEEAQNYYSKVIQSGIEKDKIRLTAGKTIVIHTN